MKKLLSTHYSEAHVHWMLLLLRLFIGGFMLTHGLPKMEKFLSGNYDFPDPLHIGGYLSLLATVFTEVVCSVLLIIGLGTRYAAIALAFTMAVATLIVHAGDPIGDKEHAMSYWLIYTVLIFLGAGQYSLDKRLFG